MALKPQISRPASTNFTRVRIGPNRVDSDRSYPAMCAPYPANKSTNASNANVLAIDLVMRATYAPAAAPTQLTGIATGTIVTWNITAGEAANAPDVLPGDVLRFLPQDNVPGAVRDALQGVGLIVLAAVVTGTGPYNILLVLWNSTGGTVATPAGYIPQLLWERNSNLSSDPNPIY